MIRFRFVNVVWGKAYTDTFVRVCLPSSLTARNLPLVAANSDAVYRIYTTRSDAQIIQKSAAVARLSKLMKVEIVHVDAELPVDEHQPPGAVSKYAAMSACHTHFIKTVAHEDAAMVFLSPDLVWADASLGRLLQLAESGKRLVMMCALRLQKETFLAALAQRGVTGSGSGLGKRELMQLSLQHLHPETRSLVWDSGQTNSWPSLLLWKAGEEGLLLRAFHLHPLMVRPTAVNIVPGGTIDDDYIARACPDRADEYVMTDSDEMLGFELSSRTSREELIVPGQHTPESLAHWARAHANARHQEFVQYRIRLHSGMSPAVWSEVEQRSDAIVHAIQSRLATSQVPAVTSAA